MNDEQYIRKAVELAGWEYDDNTLTGRSFVELPKIERESKMMLASKWLDTEDPVLLDALAAQLVRQVDAIDCDVEITCGEIAVCDPYGSILERRDEVGDRTLNTIKCIVDSGVLDADRGET